MDAVGEEEERSMEDILAAYRAMKEARQKQSEPESEPDDAPVEEAIESLMVEPEPAQEPTSDPEPAQEPEPNPEPDHSPAQQRNTESGPPFTPLSQSEPPDPEVVEAAALITTEDRPVRSLAPLAPGLALSDRLARDHHITVRGATSGRTVGYAVGAFALLALVTEQWLRATTGIPTVVVGIPLLWLAALLVLVGTGLVVVFTFVPTRRRLAVRMAGDQRQEWQRVQRAAVRLDWLWRGGVAAVAVGLLGSAAAYSLLGPAGDGVAAIGLLVALVGGVVAVLALARRSLVRRLYVQTLVLARLEEMGRSPSPADHRVGSVLRALDQLLGALPESSVRSFLSTQEAQDYLELIDQLDDRGRDAQEA